MLAEEGLSSFARPDNRGGRPHTILLFELFAEGR